MDTLFAGHDLYESISRAKFEALVADLLTGASRLLKLLLASPEQVASVTHVALVGDATRIPKVRASVGKFFGTGPVFLDTVSPGEVIATGAAVQVSAWCCVVLRGGACSDDACLAFVRLLLSCARTHTHTHTHTRCRPTC